MCNPESQENKTNTCRNDTNLMLTTYPAVTVANTLIQISIDDHNTLTQISILKLLYFINAYYLVMYNRPIINERFQAWKFGPVLPNLYNNHLAKFGYLHIAELLGDESTIPENDNTAIAAIRDVYTNLRGYKPFQLVDKTHVSNGAWHNTYYTAPYKEIPDSEIIREFRSKE